VLVDVDHSMTCMTEETFGPTLPIMKVGSVDEAIRLANDSEYGLSASVFSRDVDRAKEVALQLDCGAGEGSRAGRTARRSLLRYVLDVRAQRASC